MTTIGHRRAEERDLGFVKHAWVLSWVDSDHAGPLPLALARRTYFEAVGLLFERPRVETWVAFNPEHEEQLLGFLCLERDVLDRRTARRLPAIHFVYVKEPLRRHGVATHMLENARVDLRKPFLYTHKTATGTEIAKALRLGANWNPRFPRFPSE